MRVVLMLAVAALASLVMALVTGSTWASVLVVALAAAGIVLLLRDWRAERAAPGKPAAAPVFEETGGRTSLQAGEFSPDISDAPGGPSSDARSDQRD